MLTAAACARQLGLTVRALRLYEQHGLVRPLRSEKGWRLYGPAHITRLAAVVTLKSLGLGLRDIGELLQGDPPLAELLRLRAEAWRQAKQEAEAGLLRTEAARQLVTSGRVLSVDQLCTLIRSLKMNTMPKAYQDAANALFTPEEQAAITARKLAMQDDPTHGGAAWAVLIAEVKQLIAAGTDPASEPARAAARQWLALVGAFSGGDKAVEAKSGQFWQTALAADPQGKELPFGQAEWGFIRQAAAADRG